MKNVYILKQLIFLHSEYFNVVSINMETAQVKVCATSCEEDNVTWERRNSSFVSLMSSKQLGRKLSIGIRNNEEVSNSI